MKLATHGHSTRGILFERLVKTWLRECVAVAARFLLRYLAPSLPPLVGSEWASCRFSFSQFGEDLVLLHLLSGREFPRNVYVDVGAYHPIRFSNTLLLYKMGWRGINIDANPDSIREFDRWRPDDRNIWAALSDVERSVVFHTYPQAATNRLSVSGESSMNVLGEEPCGAVRMVTRTLNEVLAENLKVEENFAVLNIDCEGEDIRVLKGLDWNRWRPYVIMVEARDEVTTAEIVEILSAANYSLVSRLTITLIFRQVEGDRGD